MNVSATLKNESAAPAASAKRGRLLYAAAAAALFAAFGFQLWHHAVRTSATIDEPAHILAGHRHLQCLDFGINPEHPPLLKMIAAAPLAARSPLAEPAWECGSRHTPKTEMFAAGTVFVVANGIDETVVPARLAASLAGLLLAILVFAAAREMFGRLAALAALALLAFEPALIAYGSLVLTDMILTAAALSAVFAFYLFSEKSSAGRFALAALAVGLLLGAKHSAVIFLPVLGLLPLGFSMIVFGAEYLPITRTAPVARIGRAVFVYRGRFEVPLVAALSHAERANQLISLKRFEEAAADAARARTGARNGARRAGLPPSRIARPPRARQTAGRAVTGGRRKHGTNRTFCGYNGG